MKKSFLIVVALCSAFVFTSCKSKDNLYKTAYDEARQEQNEGQGQQSEPVEIAPVVSSTAKSANVDDSYRSEKVVLASGAAGYCTTKLRIIFHSCKVALINSGY